MANILETERLLLRSFTVNDAAFILQLVNTDTWLRFIGDRNIKSVEAAEAYLLNGPIKSYELNGYGLSMVMLKDTNVPIGMCGVLKRDTLDAPDIGYALLPEYEGQGYGTEIAGATLQYAFKTLGLKRILAITLADNERSVRLLNKIGFRFKEIIEIESDDEQLMLFEALA